MIWAVASMYAYRMVVRDIIVPLTLSEIIVGDLEFNLLVFIENQSVILGILTYLTSLLFLAMYYNFATQNGARGGRKSGKARKAKTKEQL